MSKTMSDRVGACGLNTFGSKMKIVEYNSVADITVQFENGNIIHTNWKAFSKGEVRNVFDKSVYGNGFLGEGIHKASESGKGTHVYIIWNGLMRRCYDTKFHEKHPTYKDVTVCEEWNNFQNFADWYVDNYYEVGKERMHLDKDILIKNNKLYSPNTSVFVPQRINALFLKRKIDRGELPIGVSRNKEKFISTISKGGNLSIEFLGSFTTINEAFESYKLNKEILIKQVADEYRELIPNKLYNALMNYMVEITD